MQIFQRLCHFKFNHVELTHVKIVLFRVVHNLHQLDNIGMINFLENSNLSVHFIQRILCLLDQSSPGTFPCWSDPSKDASLLLQLLLWQDLHCIVSILRDIVRHLDNAVGALTNENTALKTNRPIRSQYSYLPHHPHQLVLVQLQIVAHVFSGGLLGHLQRPSPHPARRGVRRTVGRVREVWIDWPGGLSWWVCSITLQINKLCVTASQCSYHHQPLFAFLTL